MGERGAVGGTPLRVRLRFDDWVEPLNLHWDIRVVELITFMNLQLCIWNLAGVSFAPFGECLPRDAWLIEPDVVTDGPFDVYVIPLLRHTNPYTGLLFCDVDPLPGWRPFTVALSLNTRELQSLIWGLIGTACPLTLWAVSGCSHGRRLHNRVPLTLQVPDWEVCVAWTFTCYLREVRRLNGPNAIPSCISRAIIWSRSYREANLEPVPCDL
jgi:hypothetical protein